MRRLAGALTLLGCALAAAPAAASTTTELSYRLSGKLTATWTAGGGERGSVSAPLAETGDLSFSSDGSYSGSVGTVGDGPASAVVRVVRALPGGGTAHCVDTLGSLIAGADFERRGRRTLLVRFGHEDVFDRGSALSAGHCAGPVAADLDPGLPAARLDLRRARRRPVKLVIRDRRPVRAGAVSGELARRIVIRFGRARVRHATRRPTARPAQEVAPDLQYRIARIGGTLTTELTGGAEPACTLLDACGLAGSLALRLGKPEGGVDLVGGDPDSHHIVNVTATRTASAGRPDGSGCTDTAASPGRVDLSFADTPAGGLRVSLGPADGPDLLRTRCAGPGADDLAGNAIAAGEIPAGRIGKPRISVVLRPAGGLRGTPFTGTSTGELTLTLEQA
ncbi:MAG TPA: hypothetical protein VF533_04410 [Solirubrobacteraceae bacterium]|jgi:hypothetical protein